VKDLVIASSDGGVIKGSFKIANEDAANGYIANAGYRISLLRILDGSINPPKIEPVDSLLAKERFLAKPGEPESINFIYNYPANIISGKYEILISALLSSNLETDSASAPLDLVGNNRFVDFQVSSCRILKEENGVSAGSEPLSLGVGKPTKIICSVKNTINQALNIIPKIQIADYLQHQDTLKTFDAPPVTLNALETKEIAVDLPDMINPATYVGELSLYEGDNKISKSMLFRWTITGVSGKLFSVAFDKSSYETGQTANVTIFYGGSSSKNTNAESVLKIFYINVLMRDGSTGQLCGQKKELFETDKTSAENPSQKIIIPITINNGCKNPVVEAQIGKGDEIFSDIGKFGFTTPDYPLTKPSEISAKIILYSLSIIFILIVIVIVSVRYLFRKNKNISKTNLLLILIVFSASFLFFGPDGRGISVAKAGIGTGYGNVTCSDGTILYNQSLQWVFKSGQCNSGYNTAGCPGFNAGECTNECLCPWLDVPPTNTPYCRITVNSTSGLTASVTLEKGTGFASVCLPKRNWEINCGNGNYFYDKNNDTSFGPKTCTYSSGGSYKLEGTMVCNNGKKTSVLCVGNDSINLPQDGDCGTAAGHNFKASDTNWGAYTFCKQGTSIPTSPVFPTSDVPASWTCQGSNGGADDKCGATKSASVIIPNIPPVFFCGEGAISDFYNNIVVCNGDTDGLTGPANETLVGNGSSACTSAKCEYYCDSNSHKVSDGAAGDHCVADTTLPPVPHWWNFWTETKP